MTVDDWARREAEVRYPTSRFSSTESHRETQMHQGDMRLGVVRAFDALLSDEAIEAARIALAARGFDVWESGARIALQAAVRAVTEGENE